MTDRAQVSKSVILVNAGSSVLRQFLNMSVVVWLTQYLLHRIPAEEYRLYPVVMAVMVFMPLFTLFLTAGLARYVTEAYARGDDERVTQIVSTMFPLLLGAAGLLLLGGGAFSWHIDWFLDIPDGRLDEARIMMGMIVLYAAVNLATSIFQTGWFARQKFVLENLIGLGQEAVRVAVLAVLLLGVSTRVMWVTVAMVSASFAGTLARMIASQILVPSLRYRPRAFRWPLVRAVTGFGGWSLVGHTSQFVRFGLTPLILNNLSTSLDVVAYDLGSKATKMMSAFTAQLYAPLTPAMTVLHATDQKERVRSAYLRGGRYAMWMTMLAAMPLVLYAHDVMRLYTKPEYSIAAPVMMLLLLGPIFFAPNMAITPLVQASAAVRSLAVRQVILHLGTLGLTYYLVAWQGAGALGCALAQVAAQVVGPPLLSWPLGQRLAGTNMRQWLREVIVPGLVPTLVGSGVWGGIRLWAGAPESWGLLGAYTLAGGAAYFATLLLCLTGYERKDLRTAGGKIRHLLHPLRSIYDRRVKTFDLVDFVRRVYLRLWGYRPLRDHARVVTWGRFCTFLGRRDGRTVVLKIPSHGFLAGREFRAKLRDPMESERYQHTLKSLKEFPVLGPHICPLVDVYPDGGYVCEYVPGANLLVVHQEIEQGRSSLLNDQPKAARILAATEVLTARLREYAARYGGLIGDWPPTNLVYDERKDCLVNVDLEGFYTYQDQAKGAGNDLDLVLGRIARLQTALRACVGCPVGSGAEEEG